VKGFLYLLVIGLVGRQIKRGELNKAYLSKVAQLIGQFAELVKVALYKSQPKL
jgi:hypothetical protein